MDELIFAFYIGSIALSVAYLAYTVYDYLRFEKVWKARSRCPGCGRWRYELYYSCTCNTYIFECRKCGMMWRDRPRE